MFTLYPNTEAAWKMAVFAKLVSNHQPFWLPYAAPHPPVTVAERGPQYTTLIEQYLTNDYNFSSYSSATDCLSLSSLPVAVCGAGS